MQGLYRRLAGFVCLNSCRNPGAWLLLALLISLPALYMIADLGVDTDLIRLLPRSSRASALTRKLEKVISDGGYFTFLIEGDDPEVLELALLDAAGRVREVDGVEAAEYSWPIEFIERYRYTLVPNDLLETAYEELLGLEAEVSPFIEDLAGDEEATFWDEKMKFDMESSIKKYLELSKYHQSSDGKVMGMLIRTSSGLTSLGNLRAMRKAFQGIGAEIREKYGVWTGVGGSHQDVLVEFDLIMADVRQTGAISLVLILLLLFLSFRSLSVVFLILYPLVTGLLWSFALVPLVIGNLNLITSFILVILFGMGVDYSIHLVKRFQHEMGSGNIEEALLKTYISTGSSVVISGLTTALALSILAVSDFRGFSEFGIIGAMSIVTILSGMFICLPSALVTAARKGWIRDEKKGLLRSFLPRKWMTMTLILLVAAGSISAWRNLEFDYTAKNMKIEKGEVASISEYKERQDKIYAGTHSPGAVYLASDLASLDAFLDTLKEARRQKGSTIGSIRSIRDYSPAQRDSEDRMTMIADIKELLEGKWTERIEDEEKKNLVDDFSGWEVPAGTPAVEELPDAIRKSFEANDSSGRHIIRIRPNIPRQEGRNAMAFARELYSLPDFAGIEGPIGETVVFAEILWLVTGEGPRLAIISLVGVFIIVWINRRSFREALWILLPLAGGVLMALGGYAAAGNKLNFFNMIVIPALLGMGVDGGVHYYRRWAEKGGDMASTQRELFDPLSIAIGTTMIGYSGMIFANHPGIRSIGNFACLGLGMVWLTTMILLPGMLEWFSKGNFPSRRDSQEDPAA